ncbi:MAG TPA: tRNA (adenosine(37)-N6)-threonylcarbamoyltransferase complex dimerization subunit type 1 TsaB [Bryobacteraceae bacterium]|jgi:tRNA threonylcarbamoyladenosine biosynthesis protein TsaB
MATLLALDTTAEFGSLALMRNGELIEEVPLHSPDGFGHVIFGAIEALLARHGLMTADVDCFAGATGPGSFTGVRVGMTVVKGLGDAAGRPVVGVSNLQAMAACGSAALRAVVLDARRGEVYGAVYDSRLQCVQTEMVLRFADWLAGLPEGDVEIIALDFTPFADLLRGRPMVQASRVLAGAIGRIAWAEFAGGRGVDPAVLDANYVRRSDAEILWKEM